MGISLIKAVSRFTGGDDAEVGISADAQKNLLMASGNPPYMEVRRRGDGWTVQTTTLLAPLAAVPTTTAALELYNNGSRLLVVSDLHGLQILSTAATQTYAIYATMTTKKAVPTLTALAVHSLSGKALVTPTATSELVTGVGTTIVANGWLPYGMVQSWGTAAATPGNSWSVPIDGKLQVPPGASLALHVVGSLATSSTFQIGVSFDWIKASLED